MKSKRTFVELVVVWGLLCSVASLNAATPWLHTDANLIKDPVGNVVVLRGVDTIDLGAVEVWRGGVINLIDRVTNKSDPCGSSPGWYPRIIRLAIYPSDEGVGSPWFFDTNPDYFYNNLLRPVVDYCRTKDMYAIIDWHYVGKNTYDKRSQTSAFWSYIAPRFANDSHVLFELFNEPLNTSGGNDTANWLTCRPDMQTWINIIRASAPNNLILVSGPSWTQQIGPAAANPLTGDNLVMVSHIYPGHWLVWGQDYFKGQVTTCLTRYPVFASEWGFWGTSEELLNGTITNYGQPLMNFYEGLKISNSAWVTDYSWAPPMFYSNWGLRIGEAEMGGFVKDTLYLKRNGDQPSDGDATPPAAPTGLTATGGNSMVSLDWNNNAEGDLYGYDIYRSTTSGSGYSKINLVRSKNSNYTDSNIIGGVTYYYVVTAIDTSFNESPDSGEASATPSDTIPPTAPTGLSAMAGNQTVSLNWNDNAEPDLAGYNVYRSTTPGSGHSKINGSLVTSSAYTDNNVINGTTYYYIVTALDGTMNESGPSNEVWATPSPTAGQSPYPGPGAHPIPGRIEGENYDTGGEGFAYHDTTSGNSGNQYRSENVDIETCGEGGYNVGWIAGGEWLEYTVDVASSGTYDVEVRVASLSSGGNLHIEFGGVNVTGTMSFSATGGWQTWTSVFDSNVVLNAGQQIMRISMDSSNWNLNWVEFTSTGDTTPPAAPTGLSATAGFEMVTLDWNDNIEGDMNGYNVYRSTTSGSGYSKLNVSLVADSNYIDDAVTNGIPYYYVVTAVDTNDYESGYSNEASATPSDYQNCAEVQAGGYGLLSDLDGDCYVDYWDLETIAYYWLHTDCVVLDNCEGADFEPVDGFVDFFDLSDFALQWLWCNNPQDPDCTPNW